VIAGGSVLLLPLLSVTITEKFNSLLIALSGKLKTRLYNSMAVFPVEGSGPGEGSGVIGAGT
jgi:hypothetical protein